MVRASISPYQTALTLAKKADQSPLDLAEAIWRLKRKEPGRLNELMGASALKRRRAYYLAGVWSRFADLKIPRQRLAAIGWTKLSILARECPPGEEIEGLDLAIGNTAKNLPAMLKGRKRARKTRCVLLYFSPVEYELFAETVLAHGANKSGRGLTGTEAALMAIVQKVHA
jgi:hypothetical protein